MIAWKHHISEDFEQLGIPCRNNGAAAGATVFLDYELMIAYLKQDGRRWHVAEIRVKQRELVFNLGCPWMATITVARGSREGFKPLIM